MQINPVLLYSLISIVILLLIYMFRLKIKLVAALKINQRNTPTHEESKHASGAKRLQSKQVAKSSAKTRYLSGISHELRTPLNVIMGYAQLLEKQAPENDPNKDKYALMRHNCEHLNHLIEGILEFSAIEAGKLKVQFEEIDLHDLLHQIATMFTHQAEHKGLSFISHIDSKLPKSVKTDHKRLQQILINLLSNAVKFTESGRVELNITYRNQVATFRIKDTGRGIEAADLIRIFEPFERVEQLNNPIKGTGLGLPITRLLVDLLGGEIKVNSVAGKGSEFTVKLMLAPTTLSNEKGLDEFSQPFNQHHRDHPSNTNHSILVVDDEHSHRMLLADMLSSQQITITTAADAKEAKRVFDKHDFSLVIIDVAMPGIDGWQLAKWLRSNAPKTKIIMLSANPRDLEASSDRSYDVYLTKPIKINQLMFEINQLLKLGWKLNNYNENISREYKSVKLPIEHQDALMNMLEIGHINGIESYLIKLSKQQVINEQQYRQLSQPIKNMNLIAFKKLINHEH